jgi:two-component system, NarL family, nitrate/nitrite sensor histidine kinase NarX
MRPARRTSLSAKLGRIGAALLVLALSSIGLTLWVTWQLQGGAAAVNEAGRLRMQTWRLAQTVQAADAARTATYVAEFERTLALLRHGDAARPLAVPNDRATSEAFDAVVADWQALQPVWLAAPTPTAADSAHKAHALVARIDTFVAAIEGQLSRWTALLSAFQLGLMGLAIAGGVAMLYTAYLFIFNPLARLQDGLARLERGDLAARVPSDSDDEFGALAAGFNRMASTLQEFTRGLEAKVYEKTETLRAERERLAALYECSEQVARSGSLDGLAQGFVRQARRVARADAALLRCAIAGSQRYALLATDCLPQQMLDGERCIAAGDCHCGRSGADVPASGARVIPIQRLGSDGAASACEREGFNHVVTVPVRLHDQVLGELDLLYRGDVPLLAADMTLLEGLAAHLAGGMEALRAAALEREAAVAEERGLLARELHDSIAQSLAFLKIQAQLLRGAMQRDDTAVALRTLGELDVGIRESTADVRELLLHFRTRTNQDDIVPALHTTLRKFELQSGLEARIDVQGHGVPLPPDVQVQLLHVVQEALSNVRKHAHARRVWLDVQQQPQWRIEVRDDGDGFDSARHPQDDTHDDTHVGLRIMRERASAIGAAVSVASQPGRGTRVVVTLPEPQAVAA